MDLRLIEQWQLLCYLLYRQQSAMMSGIDCLLLHELLVELVGESYQQIVYAYPATEFISVHIECGNEEIRFFSADKETVVLEADGSNVSELNPRVLQCDIGGFEVDEMLIDNIQQHGRYFISNKPSISAAPYIRNVKKPLHIGRKWKKFWRDPVLFVADIFRNLSRGRE